MMRKATDKIRNFGPVTLGPLKTKLETISRTNITLQVTNPLVKEDLVQKLGNIFAAASPDDLD